MTRYIVEPGQNEGTWYVKDADDMPPQVVCMTTSAAKAELVAQALNAPQDGGYQPAFDEGDGSYKP